MRDAMVDHVGDLSAAARAKSVSRHREEFLRLAFPSFVIAALPRIRAAALDLDPASL
jgi:hypothetical protein